MPRPTAKTTNERLLIGKLQASTICCGGGPVGVVEEHGLGLAVLESRTAAVRMVCAVVALLALVRVAFTRAPDAKDPTSTYARLSAKVSIKALGGTVQ